MAQLNQTAAVQPSNDLPTVLVLGPPGFLKFYEKQLSEKFHLLKPYESPRPILQFLSAHAAAVRSVLCSGRFQLTGEILRHLPKAEFICTTSAGLDRVDLSECRRRGIRVVNTGDIYSEDVADLAVGLLIDVLSRISAGNRFLKAGLWPFHGQYPLGTKLGDKRVGIVGLGRIGLAVAKRLEPFGCTISYNSRKKKLAAPYPFYQSILELARDSDILVVCCALTNETHHAIGREVLLALGKGGIFVNVARGAIVDEKELVGCLKNAEIAGAGLDVFENEPKVPNVLFSMENVVLSPHVGVFTEESLRAVYQLVNANLDAFFSGQPLFFEVGDDREANGTVGPCADSKPF